MPFYHPEKQAAIHAGKVMAATAIDPLETPARLEEGKAEFLKRTRESYPYPIPADAVPVIPE